MDSASGPHFVDQSAFYSNKLKTEPVKIAFPVDIAGHAMAGANAVAIRADAPDSGKNFQAVQIPPGSAFSLAT